MSKSESKNPWKNLVVGGAAGAIEATIMYPTEFIKTQLQLEANAAKKAKAAGLPIPEPKYKGVIDCVKVTVKEKGPFGLYRGLSTLVVGSIPKAGVRFVAFQEFAKRLKDDKGKLTPFNNMLAGLGAGVSEALLAVTPMETVKTKFIHDNNKPEAQRKYRGLVSGCATIFKEEGFGGFYKGTIPTCLKQGCNQAVRFTIFNQMKGMIQKGDAKREMSPVESMLVGGVAGIVSVYATMPFDVVKTRMQGLEAKQYKNAIDCGIKVIKEEGVAALWKGTTPRLSRVMFSSGIIFTCYEQIMRLVTPYWPEPETKPKA